MIGFPKVPKHAGETGTDLGAQAQRFFLEGPNQFQYQFPTRFAAGVGRLMLTT